MKVLLRERVKDLGGAGDIVEVAEGYARNYLLTQRLAMVPNDTNIRRVQEEGEKREAARKDKLAHLTSLAEKLSNVSITVKSSANELGHLFGSVTEKHIAEALSAEGFDIKTSQVHLAEPIRTLDRFHVPVRLTEDVEAVIDLWVVPE